MIGSGLHKGCLQLAGKQGTRHGRCVCVSCSYRLSIINLVVGLGFMVLKFFIAFTTGSRAMFAAGIYSINDVLSAIIVLVSSELGSKPADRGHTYGHGKAEFILTALASLVPVIAVVYIFHISLSQIICGIRHTPSLVVLVISVASLGANEWLARKGFCNAQHLDDNLTLEASAEHNRADAISSLAVIVGVGGAFLGFHVLDQIVAIFETVHISWTNGHFFGKSVSGLMDASLSSDELAQIHGACQRVPGVSRVKSLKSRQGPSGGWVDVVVQVDRNLTVDEGHEIAERVKARVRSTVKRSVETQVRFKTDEITDGLRSRKAVEGACHG